MPRESVSIGDQIAVARRSMEIAEECLEKVSDHRDCTEGAKQLVTVTQIFTGAVVTMIESLKRELSQPDTVRGDARVIGQLELSALLIHAVQNPKPPKDRAKQYMQVAERLLAASLDDLEQADKARMGSAVEGR